MISALMINGPPVYWDDKPKTISCTKSSLIHPLLQKQINIKLTTCWRPVIFQCSGRLAADWLTGVLSLPMQPIEMFRCFPTWNRYKFVSCPETNSQWVPVTAGGTERGEEGEQRHQGEDQSALKVYRTCLPASQRYVFFYSYILF